MQHRLRAFGLALWGGNAATVPMYYRAVVVLTVGGWHGGLWRVVPRMSYTLTDEDYAAWDEAARPRRRVSAEKIEPGSMSTLELDGSYEYPAKVARAIGDVISAARAVVEHFKEVPLRRHDSSCPPVIANLDNALRQLESSPAGQPPSEENSETASSGGTGHAG